MRHLACVPTGKNDGLLRLQRVSFFWKFFFSSLSNFMIVIYQMLAELEPPLILSTKSIDQNLIPFITVRNVCW